MDSARPARALHIAAAAPVIPWSDLDYSLVPNGRTLDYRLACASDDLNPFGVEKQSFVTGLYAEGNEYGYYAAAGRQPPGRPHHLVWRHQCRRAVRRQRHRHRQPDRAVPLALLPARRRYGTALEPPAPLLIANGFTDDLFPVDEALRYYNLDRARCIRRTRSRSSMATSATSAPTTSLPTSRSCQPRSRAFFDYYLKRVGATPRSASPRRSRPAPRRTVPAVRSRPPTWAGLHPGEVDFSSSAIADRSPRAPATRRSPRRSTRSPARARAQPSRATDQGSGVATYRLPAARGSGYTLLGSPTVIARLAVTGPFPELAARLWDVNPDTNTETLVARALYRPTASGAAGVPAPPRGVALHRRPHPQARAAGTGLALRPDLQRALLDRRQRPATAAAGARAARGAPPWWARRCRR